MNTNPEAWSKAIAGLGGQLVEALKPVAAKMGVAAEHLYGVLVKQALVDSIANLISFGLIALFLMIVGYKIRKSASKCNEKVTDPDFLTCAGWVVQGVAAIIIACTINANIAGILNPEYYAIRELMHTAANACQK